MRVGLNAEPLFQRIPTGVGVYALALCRRWTPSPSTGLPSA